MFSVTRYFRRCFPWIAVLLCLLGCAAPAHSPTSPQETVPFLPTQSPTAPPEASAPSASLPAEPGETLPREPAPEEAGFIRPDTSITAYRKADSSGIFFAVNEQSVPGEISRQEITHSMASLDGSIQALLTDRNALWLILEGQLLQLTDNAVFADLSLSGEYILWIDAAGILCGYDITEKQTEQIAENAASAAVSPVGKTVAYSVSNPDGSISAWLRTDGEARPFGEELMPFALTQWAEAVFALGTQDGLLHILDETGASIGKASDLLPGGEVFLSSDHRQILFPCPEGWHLRGSTGQETLIESPRLKRMVTPADASILRRESISICSATLPTDNLLGHFYLDAQNNLWYLDTDATLSSVAQTVDAETLSVSWDGATLFYRWEDGTLFRTHRSCPGSPTILAAEVEAFAPTWDGAGIYCLDSENRLTYLEDFHDPRIVSEAVTDFGVTWDGYCLYLTASGEAGSTLWVSQLGSPGTPAETGAASLRITPSAVYLTLVKEAQLDLYCATEAFAFLLLAENVM